ncbi:hypothetical protein CEXT_485531 [Caerostris extrusa]|uniref:Uncharacterized protein n=1 Tax=Caerostris extrusa TaxID=172846 RepID=A0AAV4VYT0_CAEEX|nr:hypothetical protein CEXT_485531 [Caerostris extrusa]
MELAFLVQKVASKELEECEVDAVSVLSFEEKVEATKDNLGHVVDLFSKTNTARKAFMDNFDSWAPVRKDNISRLRTISKEILKDRFNGCISKVVGGGVGAAGGVLVGVGLLVPPVAPVAIPLAVGGGIAAALGGGVVVGTTGTEIVLLKKKLAEAKKLIKIEEENFKLMTHWFNQTQQLKKALEALVGMDLLKTMSDEVVQFLKDTANLAELKAGEYKEKFEYVMKTCVQQMHEFTNIAEELGPQIAPIVMSFIFVYCVLSGRNRIVLDGLMVTQRLALGLMSAVDITVEAGRLFAGLAVKGSSVGMSGKVAPLAAVSVAGKVVPAAVSRIAALGFFVGLGIAIDIINMILASKEIHTGAKSKYADQITSAAGQLEEEYLFLQNVYEELCQYKTPRLQFLD